MTKKLLPKTIQQPLDIDTHKNEKTTITVQEKVPFFKRLTQIFSKKQS